MKHPSHRHGQSTSRITLLILSCAVFAFSIDAGAQGRVRTSKKVGGKSLAEDIKVVSDAQTRALALAEEMLKKKKTEEDKKSVQTVIDMIKKAQVFTEASSKDRSKLTDAVRAQELAFQALLELATREHNIKRQQSKSKGQPGKNRNQQQLNQLELKMKENKYETRTRPPPAGHQRTSQGTPERTSGRKVERRGERCSTPAQTVDGGTGPHDGGHG
jgi:hypothetical protein